MGSRAINRVAGAVATLCALLAIFVPSAQALKSTVTTGGVEGVTETGAHLLGDIDSAGDLAWYGFEYGTSNAYGLESEIREAGKGEIPVDISVGGLEPETTYHYQLAAITKYGEFIYGGDRTFTTLGPRKWRAAEYPASISGAQKEGAALTMTFEAGLTFSCESTNLSGEMAKAAYDLDLSPTFEGCSGFGFGSATASANGCSYQVNPGLLLVSTLGISCPEGKAIQISASSCTVTIPAQSGLASGLIITQSTTPTTVSDKFSVSHLTYDKTQDGFLCPLAGTGQKEDGAYTGTAVLSARNSTSSPIGFRVGP